MAYKRVTVKEHTYPGEEVEKVIYPDVGGPALFTIYLKSGLMIVTTQPVTVVEEYGK